MSTTDRTSWRTHAALPVLVAAQMAAAAVALAVLKRLDAAGPAPLGLMVALVGLAALVGDRRTHSAITRGDLTRWLWPRAVGTALLVTPALYLPGWGPMVIPAFGAAALMQIRWSGSRAWRPAVAGMLAGTFLGQLGIATGLFHSYLSPAFVHAVAVGQVTVFALLLGHLGLMVAGREEAEERTASRERRSRKLVQYASDLITLIGDDGRILWISPSAERMLGRSADELVGREVSELAHEQDRAIIDDLGRRVAADPGQPQRAEYRYRHPDGSIRWHEVVGTDLLHDPDVGAVVVNQRDVTETHRARQRLAHDATHDPLTGLANRAVFFAALERSLDRLAGGTQHVAVLYVDLDAFKAINDALGHEAGDTVLVAVAQALRSAVLGSDLVARLGGDEFAVVLTHLEQPDDAVHVARRIGAVIRSPIEIRNQVLIPEASIGIAVADGSGMNSRGLLHRADVAMYHAKRSRQPWLRYHPGLDHVS